MITDVKTGLDPRTRTQPHMLTGQQWGKSELKAPFLSPWFRPPKNIEQDP